MRTVTGLLLFLASTALASITGSVVDEEGKPIGGATIRAYAAEPSRIYRQRLISGQPENDPFATATTDAAGAFTIDAKGNIAVDLRVDREGRQPSVTEAVDGDEPLTIILRPASARKMRVTAGGKPVANALVLFAPHLTQRTDEAGEVPLIVDAPGWIIHPDYAAVRPSSGGGAMTSVELQKGVAIRGRAVNAKGAGVRAKLFIAAMPVGESGDDGAFVVGHAPADWKSLRAMTGAEAAMVARPRVPQIEIHLAPAPVLSGTLRDDATGRPVAGARMTLSVQRGEQDADMVVTDAKGNFAFDPMPPHLYTVVGRHPAYFIEQSSITLAESTARAIAAQPPGRMRGRVIDEARKPVAGVVVSSAAMLGAGAPKTLTDDAGNFSLRVPPAAMPFSITATKRGYATGSTPRRKVKGGEVVNDVVITMPHGFPLQVQIVDQKRQPMPDAVVYAYASEADSLVAVACDDPWRDNCRRTGADGGVTFRLAEGEYWFNIVPAGPESAIAPKRLAAQTITARSSPLVVVVERAVALSGKVVYGDGKLVPDVSIEVRGGTITNRNEQSADGTFTFTGLGPGKYTMIATTVDGRLSTPPLDVAAPAANVVLTMARGGRIEGRVIDRATQQPITDFTVSPLRRQNPSFGEGEKETHADDGSFALENVPPGTATLRVAARGYVTATRGDIEVEEGRTVRGIDVTLERGAKLSGHVTAVGKAVAGVLVRAVSLTGSNLATGVSDADGQYSIDGIPSGEQTFEFRKQGFITKRQNVETSATKDVHLDVELDRGRELRGRVVDKSGSAVAGASLSAYSPTSENAQAISESDGSFVLEGLGDSRCSVQARKSGYVSATVRDVDVPQASPLTITLDRGTAITGRVTGLPPSELGAVHVNASGADSSSSAQTDASGAFTLRGVPDGRLTVIAYLMGSERRSRSKNITVENGVAPPLEIDFQEGFTVRGRVTFNGTPTATGSITFRPASAAADQTGGWGRVSGGAYEVNGLAAGDYNVMVSSPDGSYRSKYTVSGPGTLDIDVRGATLHGRVVDAASGAPVPDAMVAVSGPAVSLFRNQMSDSDGRFAVTALLDGKYSLAVQRESYSPATREVVVSGGLAPDVEVRLEGGTATTLLAVDAITGASLFNASVWVLDSAGKRVSSGMMRSDDGVRLWLQPGRYTASASAVDYLPALKVEFGVPGPPVRLLLSRGGTLYIEARSAHTVRIDGPVGYRSNLRLAPGMNGPYKSLPPGQYAVEVLDDGDMKRVIASVPVFIVSGEKATVAVD